VTPSVTPSITPSITPSSTPPTYYFYEAEIRYCNDCGFNAGTVYVQSTSPITTGNYAIEYPVPSPVLVTYKIIGTTLNAPSLTVVNGGSSCFTACNSIPPE
jgi:hypothetical protein